MIGSILSAAIVNKLGMSKTLLLGGLGLTMMVFSQVIPAWRAEFEDVSMIENKFVIFLF
tara:strand:+ start:266 stop:442 length:177 start_codon:yes stop_codon:yes gene_type:complete